MKRTRAETCDTEEGNNGRLTTRFCSITVILLLVGGLTLWNTTELAHFVGTGLEMTSTTARSGRSGAPNNNVNISITISNTTTTNNSFIIPTKSAIPSKQQWPQSSARINMTELPEALLPVGMFHQCCGEGKNKFEQVCLTKKSLQYH